jgi:hypothetical protein
MKKISNLFLAAVLTFITFGCTTDKGTERTSSNPPPPPPDEQTTASDSGTQTGATDDSGAVDIDKLPKKKGYPYGIKTNTPGLVKSPYAPDKALVDVSRFQSGNFVRCPHTGKIFVVP